MRAGNKNMAGLGLSDHRLHVPASAFPESADVYFCDNCERDITKHFFRGKAHTWEPMGPESYVCDCSREYLTGAVEWDNLSHWQRQRRIRDTLGLGIFLSAAFSIAGFLAYLVSRALYYREAAMMVALAITVFPFILLIVPFALNVAASIWRTRVKLKRK